MDAAAWDARYAASDQVWSLTPNQFVAAELADLAPGRALDVACGEGRNALWLARRGWSVTGLDFSAVALERAAGLADDLDVTWVVGDALQADLPEVDLVVLAYLQLPPEQRGAVVRRTFGALADGGTFLLVAHDSTNLAEGTGGPQDPAVLYTAEDVLADLDGQHFRVVHAARVAREIPGTPGTHQHEGTPDRTAYDALVRLVREG